MNYFQDHKKALTICSILGFLIAILMRFSFFTFSDDFEYYRFGPIRHPVPQIGFDQTHCGKEVIGMSGFPFRTYSDCVISLRGTLPGPSCRSYSLIGEFSVILNTIIWGCLFYVIWLSSVQYCKISRD